MKKEGICWVNLGDSYAGVPSGSPIYKTWQTGGIKDASDNYRADLGKKHSVPSKSLCGIPERFAIRMTDELGWIRRNTVIWHKPNCMPQSANDRFTVDFEYVYFFTKSGRYYFKQLFEPAFDWGTRDRSNFRSGTQDPLLKHHGLDNGNFAEQGRNKRAVWSIPTQPNNDSVKTSRLSRVALDDASDDMRHILFPNCPAHEDLLAQAARVLYDAPLDDMLNRNQRIGSYLAQKQANDFYLSVKPLLRYSWEHNLGYSRLLYLISAKHRSIENHKKAHALLTSFSYNAFVEILSRIDDIRDALWLSWLYLGMNGSRISLDGLDAHLLARIFSCKTDRISCSYCQFYHIKTSNTSHFATFPPDLISPMIEAGCPEQICKKCGTAREVIYKESVSFHSGSGRAGNKPIGKFEGWPQTESGDYDIRMGPKVDRVEMGLTDCQCGAGFEPGIICDIFAGTGTTCYVAKEMGRRYIGIDLSEEYIEIAEKKNAQEMLL